MAENKFNPLEQSIYNVAIENGKDDRFSRIVISQLKHESGNFTSNVFKKNNNPMGMKMPSKRKSPYIAGKGTQPPGNEGATPYARYNSLEDAVRDLFHFFQFNGYNFDRVNSANNEKDAIVEYAEEMRKHGYMGNSQTAKNIYIAGLSNWFKRISNLSPAAGSIGILVFIVLVVLFFTYYK